MQHINQYMRFRELYQTGVYKAKLSVDKGAFSIQLYKCIRIPFTNWKIAYGKHELSVATSMSQLAFAENLYHSSFKTQPFGREDRMNFAEYSAYVMHGFMENATHDSMDLMHALIGMSGELGEVQESVKKHIFHGKEFDRIKLIEEMGDAVWYQTAFMSLMGISFIDILVANKTKLDQRYKNGRRDLMFRNPKLEYKIMTEKLKEKKENDLSGHEQDLHNSGHPGVAVDQLSDEGRREHFKENQI